MQGVSSVKKKCKSTFCNCTMTKICPEKGSGISATPLPTPHTLGVLCFRRWASTKPKVPCDPHLTCNLRWLVLCCPRVSLTLSWRPLQTQRTVPHWALSVPSRRWSGSASPHVMRWASAGENKRERLEMKTWWAGEKERWQSEWKKEQRRGRKEERRGGEEERTAP